MRFFTTPADDRAELPGVEAFAVVDLAAVVDELDVAADLAISSQLSSASAFDILGSPKTSCKPVYSASLRGMLTWSTNALHTAASGPTCSGPPV